MASIGKDGPKGDRYRVLFTDAAGNRKTLRLGRVNLKTAQAICRHVEAIVAGQASGQPLDRQTAVWLAEIGADLRSRLERAGLIEPVVLKERITVARLVEEYIAGRTDVKAGTRINLDLAGRNLVAFMGDKLVEDVTEADAEAFFRHLTAEDGPGLAQNTARRRAGRARQFFAHAIRRRLIATNPFATSTVKVAVGGNPERQHYVAVDVILSVIDAAPDHEWRLIIALSRFAGLRCPSEHLALTWADILWDRSRFVVRSPKTEHLEGKASRVVPIFPELEPYLREAFDLARPGQVHVITRYRDPAQNLRTTFLKIIKRAGLAPWPRLFHNLRASCQTDLAGEFPAHVVCAWLGNSLAVAQEHYLSVNESHFEAAVGSLGGGAQSGARGAHFGGVRQAHGREPQGAEGSGSRETEEAASAALVGGSLRQGAERSGTGEKKKATSGGAGGGRGMTPRGLEEPHDSPQETALLAEGGAQRRTLAEVLALVEQLTPGERAELLRVLTERETQSRVR